ncbi:hypothetical protein [Mesorhizobium sp. INR15]|uniref:hypothetical protein n=1 Tax=Mesorhizobium sp. INR15 TaxID=2654248 RepID=UPI00189689D1|nr:hypothetical protein [Mesorhizobium sp. INR15]QPC91454.1 hypothetical protein GA829_13005 [Mesorhizobium sp. INR15]
MANRVLLGAIGGSYKLKVSRPGFDVTTALPNEQLAFSSDWGDAGKVLMTGSVAMGASGVLQLVLPIFTARITVIAMISISGVFYPLSTFGNVIYADGSIGLRTDLSSIAFSKNGSTGNIIYYVVMVNQFGS